VYSFEVNALVSPPTASIDEEISSDDLFLVPFHSK
jgi:hypothetical protein